MPKLTKPPATRKHKEERNKLLAGGAQLLALALIGSGVLAPLFNRTLVAPLWEQIVIGVVAALLESTAVLLLRYIPFPNEPSEAHDANVPR